MTVAGALERKVWIRIAGRTLYPNLYALLVGGPGVGKTDALRNVYQFWDNLPNLHVAPSSVSRASLVDELNEAERQILRPADLVQPYVKFNSLQVAATEFGTFLTAYDNEFLSTLNDLYDCIRYKEKKRGMKNPIELPAPQLNLIAATTPAWLSTNLPETAWYEGFCSRLIVVYSGERRLVDLFNEISSDEVFEAELNVDLKEIHNMYGQMSFETEVAEMVQEWYMGGCQPAPEHPKLEHYLSRRHTHFLKLCMVMSAGRASDYVIRMPDFRAAMDMLLEAEAYMPDIFKAMKTSSDSSVMDETYAFVYSLYAKDQKAVAEHRIVAFIAQRIPTHSVVRTLEIMVSANILQIASVAGEGGRKMYKPSPKAQHNL